MWYNLYIRVYKLNLVLLRVNIYPLSYKGKAFMKTKAIAHLSVKTDHPELSFAWNKDSSVQKLLDVVIHILANEYIWAVKENPTLFSDNGGAK